jgi:hypothetical protein
VSWLFLRRALAQFSSGRTDVHATLVSDSVPPGKAGAIRRGLEELGEQVDVVVLTDADVVLDEQALVELVRAFEADPRLGLACGSQRFVRELTADGRAPAGEQRDAGGVYDRVTAWVRRLESWAGRLFSVHGQLLAWRASPRLAPTLGLAADDLDLRLAAREQGLNVERVAAARFFEVKAPEGTAREAQALRRARAFLQFVDDARVRRRVRALSTLDRVHFALYQCLPSNAPWWLPLGLAALALAGLLSGSSVARIGGLVLLAAAALGALRLAHFLGVIRSARLAEREGTQADRWTTARR